MKMARESLTGIWGIAIGTFLLYTVIMGSFGAMRQLGVIGLIIGGPMLLGAARFSLSIVRDEEARMELLFEGFKNFATALVTYLLMVLYIFLWTLLLIIPGIIAALSYSMTFYILADEPEIKPSAALQLSKSMMDGSKMKLFTLGLWFFLLSLLCVLTLGIGFLWLIPYANVTLATFYEDIKETSQPDHQQYEEKEIV